MTIKSTEGVTLSGAVLRRGLQADGTLEKLIELSAEGAKRVSLISQAKGQRFNHSLFVNDFEILSFCGSR